MLKKLITPFGEISNYAYSILMVCWIALILTFWGIHSVFSDTHLFPTIEQVLEGFVKLWKRGVVNDIFSSLALCGKAVGLSVILSLLFVYLSPLPLLKPLATSLSKFRFLPLTGVAFYIMMLIDDGRAVQVSVLVVFMTTYLVTSLIATIKDIPEEEFNHAKTLGCSRWEVLLEVVIKGRFDYVIEVIRQNVAIVWMMIVTVEAVCAASGGLGFLIKNSDKLGGQGSVVALQIIILVIGLLLDISLTKLRKLLFGYSKF